MKTNGRHLLMLVEFFFFLSMGNGDTNADEDDVMGRFVIVTTKLLVT